MPLRSSAYMDPLAVLARLASIVPRAASGDGERRAAVWLSDTLRARGHDVALQTLWVRPRWELATASCATLAGVGAIVSVWQATPGLILTALALALLAGEQTGLAQIARRLAPERATQNLSSVATPIPAPGRTRLVIAANLDAGRCGSIYADRWTGLEARLRRLARGHLSSPQAFLTADVAALVALCAARSAGVTGGTISAIQFGLIVIDVVATAALLDIALSDVSPGANANGSGVVTAIALYEQLRETALRTLEVELVLAGAGEGGGLGMRALTRARRGLLTPDNAIVLAIEPCGDGSPYWLERDGRLLGLRMHPTLRRLMATVASEEGHLGATPRRSHGISSAHPARRAGWPAIAVGCGDPLGRTPRARQAGDLPELVDAAAMQATLELCLAFVGRLDAELSRA